MDFFGIGPLELLLILIILMVVVGPEKIPEFARRMGRAVRAFRGATSSFTRELEREIGIDRAAGPSRERGVGKKTEKTKPGTGDQSDGSQE